jgi:aspartyl-tRNA(Asn)/glutamyl-tRNA(Gln) amidotransferase subunit A
MQPLSIAGIAAAVVSGEISATDVIAEALTRADASQVALNAFTYLDHERAMEAAGHIDARVARGLCVGALAGVPIAIKDLMDHRGRPNSYGSSGEPAIPETTAHAVVRLEGAGAVIIGRTGLHEFGFGFSSENHWFGPVHNPWDLTLSPGGSSGGSAAAVAAGVVPAAVGTDTGGSVRVPAAMCGIVGLKPSHGRVSLSGVQPLAPMLDTVGPLARTVADAAAVYEAMAGDDPSDPWSVPQPVHRAQGPADLSEVTIGVPRPWTDLLVVADQHEAFRAWLEHVSASGATVVELDLPNLRPSSKTLDSLYFEAANVHRSAWVENPDQFGPEVGERIEEATKVSGEAFLDALAWRRSLRAEAMRGFERVDVLATPTVASLRKPIGSSTVNVLGEEIHYAKAKAMFTTPVNHAGLPALALALPGASQPPPSVQIIGPQWSEQRLIEIGIALEKSGAVAVAKPPHWRPGEVGGNPERTA